MLCFVGNFLVVCFFILFGGFFEPFTFFPPFCFGCAFAPCCFFNPFLGFFFPPFFFFFRAPWAPPPFFFLTDMPFFFPCGCADCDRSDAAGVDMRDASGVIACSPECRSGFASFSGLPATLDFGGPPGYLLTLDQGISRGGDDELPSHMTIGSWVMLLFLKAAMRAIMKSSAQAMSPGRPSEGPVDFLPKSPASTEVSNGSPAPPAR